MPILSGDIVLRDIDSIVPANFGVFVRSKSSLRLELPVTPISPYTKMWYWLEVTMNGSTVISTNSIVSSASLKTILLYMYGNFKHIAGSGTWLLTIRDVDESTGSTRYVEEGSITRTGSFMVYDWAPPVIHSFSVRRYSSYIDDLGITQYEDSDVGDHVRIGISADVSAINGKNAFSLKLKYKIVGSSSETTVPITTGIDGRSMFYTMDRSLVPGIISTDKSYEFRLILTDWFAANGLGTSAESFDGVPKAEAVMHVGPYGVAFGGFSTATPTAKKDEFAVPVYFSDKIYDGEDEIQDPGWTDLVFLNGENRTFPPDYHLQYKKIGKHVWIRGIITFSFTGTSKAICDLPFPATGGKIIYAVGGGNNRVSLSIAYATQTLNISGVTSAAGASVTNFNSWVDCSIDYWTD